ncbi:MAG: type II toxin-antitoxin system HicB family antitoxin [Methanosarcinales archaeon]|nr:type II toxin-antitoxin system HicB family antitoxin [Methanosarcinales archaeon]
MLRHFTLEYWLDEEWYVGRLREVPGVFSQGESLEELEENIRDVYRLMMEEEGDLASPQTAIMAKELGVEA